jgi:hypothetical protein
MYAMESNITREKNNNSTLQILNQKKQNKNEGKSF